MVPGSGMSRYPHIYEAVGVYVFIWMLLHSCVKPSQHTDRPPRRTTNTNNPLGLTQRTQHAHHRKNPSTQIAGPDNEQPGAAGHVRSSATYADSRVQQVLFIRI